MAYGPDPGGPFDEVFAPGASRTPIPSRSRGSSPPSARRRSPRPATAATRSSSSRGSRSTPPARTARSATARSRSTSCRGSCPPREWDHIERGLAQRIRALNRFIDDVYHEREIVRAGIVPWQLIVSRSHFARAAHGIRPPGGVYCHVAGCDLVRDADGSWKVLEDNVRTPSGISYVLENRVAMTRLVPQLFRDYRVRPVDHYPQLLPPALRERRAERRGRGDGRRLDARAR